MLVEPDRSAYDLKFRLFGFPVRVHPWFWLLTVLFGASAFERYGPQYLVAWVGVVFVSILVHELGHALAFRWFGVDSHVVLYSFGGLAVPWGVVPGRWRRVVVSLTGPAAGFVLFGAVYASNLAFGWGDDHGRGFGKPSLAAEVFRNLVFVNLAWGLVNLLPVFPLDGGQVAQEVCGALSPRNGVRVALEISVGVAGLVCLYSLACEFEGRRGGGWLSDLPDWFPRGSFYTALLFGMLAYQSYQQLQHSKWTDAHWSARGR